MVVSKSFYLMNAFYKSVSKRFMYKPFPYPIYGWIKLDEKDKAMLIATRLINPNNKESYE